MAIKTKKELEILISVQAKELEELRKKLKNLPDEAGDSGKKTGTSFSNGLKSVAGLLAGGAFIAAVKNIFSEAISQSRKFEQAIIGLRATAKQTGTDFDDLRKGIEKLSEDGQIGIDSLSRTVSSLLKQGLSVEKAFQFAEATKRIAAFTRTTDTLAQSQEDFTKALALGSMELGENLGSFGRVVKEMGGWVKVSSDMATKQKFVNIVIAEASKLGQDYVENFLESGTAQQARFNLELAKAASQLGDVLAPAIAKVLGFASGLIKSFQDLSERSKLLIFIVPIVVGIIGSFIAWTITVGGLSAAFAILWGAILGPITLVIAAIVGITVVIVGISEAMKDTKTESEKLADSIVELGNVQNKTKEQTKKLKTEIDKLGKSYKKLAEDILNSNISLSNQKTLMEDISKLEGLSREQSLIQTTGIINAMNARMLFLETLNRREIAIGDIEEFTFGEDVPSPLIPMGIESGPQIRLLRQRLVLQEKIKQSLLNQTDAQKKFNKATGDGGKKAKEIFRDNILLLNEWSLKLRTINDQFEKEEKILIKNKWLIRQAGESQEEFRKKVKDTTPEQEKLNKKLQEGVRERKQGFAELKLGIDRLNTGLGGFRDGLQGISDKDMPAIISGIGGMVMAFNPLIGGIIVGLGATLDILGDILSGEDELEKAKDRQLKQIERAERAGERTLARLKLEIALRTSLLDIERARNDLIFLNLQMAETVIGLFGTPEEQLAVKKEALGALEQQGLIPGGFNVETKKGLLKAGEFITAETTKQQTLQIISDLMAGQDLSKFTAIQLAELGNSITKLNIQIGRDSDIQNFVDHLFTLAGLRQTIESLQRSGSDKYFIKTAQATFRQVLASGATQTQLSGATLKQTSDIITEKVDVIQADVDALNRAIDLGIQIVELGKKITEEGKVDFLAMLDGISAAAARTIEANTFTQEKIAQQKDESDSEFNNRQFQSTIDLAEKNAAIAQAALDEIVDQTGLTTNINFLTKKINISGNEFKNEQRRAVIDAIKFSESQNDILQGIWDERIREFEEIEKMGLSDKEQTDNLEKIRDIIADTNRTLSVNEINRQLTDKELAASNVDITQKSVDEIAKLTGITTDIIKLTDQINKLDAGVKKTELEIFLSQLFLLESQQKTLEDILKADQDTAKNTAVLKTTADRAGTDFFSIDIGRIFSGGSVFQLNPDALKLDRASVGLAVTTQAVSRLTPELRTAEATEQTANNTEEIRKILLDIKANTNPTGSSLVNLSENLELLTGRSA